PSAILHVWKVVAKCADGRFGQPLRDGLERRVAHVRAGPVAQDKQVACVIGQEKQGGYFSLVRRGHKSHLSCFVSHSSLSEACPWPGFSRDTPGWLSAVYPPAPGRHTSQGRGHRPHELK